MLKTDDYPSCLVRFVTKKDSHATHQFDDLVEEYTHAHVDDLVRMRYWTSALAIISKKVVMQSKVDDRSFATPQFHNYL